MLAELAPWGRKSGILAWQGALEGRGPRKTDVHQCVTLVIEEVCVYIYI